MTQVVTIPRHLANVVNTEPQILVSAGTAGAVIDELLSRHPELRVHLFEESGVLRPHLICFIDGEPSRLRNPDCEVQREITFLHAVSGGSS